MAKIYGDNDKYATNNLSQVVSAYHSSIRDIVRKRLDEAGGDWESFVFDKSYSLVTADDFLAVEKTLLDAGHRFDFSAVISVTERPDAYKPAEGVGADNEGYVLEHPDAPTGEPDAAGRALCGIGDNVVPYPENTIGTARYVRSSEQVMNYLTNGVPPDTIAVIDDSGGTLTAPILEHFKGVICLGGTVRSHLGILSREYGIACFMNSKVSGIREGQKVEMESTAKAKTAEAYQEGREMTANVWKFEE